MRSILTNMRPVCLLLLLLLGSLPRSYAQTIKPAPVDLAFEKKIPDWLKETNVPAVGIGIIEDGKLKYTKVFGELRRGGPTQPRSPAPPNTIFQVASLTKPVVEVLTLKLVSSGKWNLDEPLANYWVDPDVQNDPRHKKLTTRHVLTHQSGFPNWRYLNASNKLEFMAEPSTKGGLFRRRSRIPAPRFGKEIQGANRTAGPEASLSALRDDRYPFPLGHFDGRVALCGRAQQRR